MRLINDVVAALAIVLAVGASAHAQDDPKVRGSKVVVSGKNPFIALSLKAGERRFPGLFGDMGQMIDGGEVKPLGRQERWGPRRPAVKCACR